MNISRFVLKHAHVSFLLAAMATSLSATGAFAADAGREGFHDESEAGIVIVGGNSETKTYDLKQTNTYGWDRNGLKFDGRFLTTSARSTETARFWLLGLRFERGFADRFSLYAGQLAESNVFAGFRQRYSSDLGGKYFIYKEAEFTWSTEAGYRFTIENRLAGQINYHMLRFFTEATRNFSKDVMAKLWLEFLPNLTRATDYQFNSELSLYAALNETFSVKTAYLLKYRHAPPPGIAEKSDTCFTTALVARF